MTPAGTPRQDSDRSGPSGLERLGNGVMLGLRLVAACLLLVMMALTFIDVIGRYVFSAPLPGAFELTEILLGLVIFAGLPLVTLRGEHVSVDLVTSRLSPPMRNFLARAAAVITLAVLSVLAWRLWVLALDLTSYGDATVFLRIPLGPVAAVMAVLAVGGALTALIVAVRR